jgi:hypothetical protein
MICISPPWYGNAPEPDNNKQFQVSKDGLNSYGTYHPFLQAVNVMEKEETAICFTMLPAACDGLESTAGGDSLPSAVSHPIGKICFRWAEKQHKGHAARHVPCVVTER